MHNCARMQLRKRARRVHLPLEEQNAEAYELSVSERIADQRPGPEEECRQSELSRRLYHCQTQLSPTLRLAFQLRDVEGLSIRETARILGVQARNGKGSIRSCAQEAEGVDPSRGSPAISESDRTVYRVFWSWRPQ